MLGDRSSLSRQGLFGICILGLVWGDGQSKSGRGLDASRPLSLYTILVSGAVTHGVEPLSPTIPTYLAWYQGGVGLWCLALVLIPLLLILS